jgi:LmbE family N-acetylglucosaminyl deacetylase
VTERRLLGIYAHPDDESYATGGALARYARSGVQVHVCTVTDGASGSVEPGIDEGGPRVDLAQLRRQELLCAVEVLGARLWMLSYRDSGMEGTPENHHPDSLYQADLDRVARDLVRVIRQVRPHVVLTHDPTGAYYHPDHIRVNHAVSRAWPRAGDARAYPDLVADGLAPWQPSRLYYVVLSRSALRWRLLTLRLLGRNPRRFGRRGDIDLTRLGLPGDQIHVRLDVSGTVDVKLRASACHRSQGGESRLWPRFMRRRYLRYEYYVQAQPPDASAHADLFEGVDTA